VFPKLISVDGDAGVGAFDGDIVCTVGFDDDGRAVVVPLNDGAGEGANDGGTVGTVLFDDDGNAVVPSDGAAEGALVGDICEAAFIQNAMVKLQAKFKFALGISRCPFVPLKNTA
jgi:hypothetical protein